MCPCSKSLKRHPKAFAARYSRAGADKVSLGSDAVYAAEVYIANNRKRTGESSIEAISHVYGAQAVVVFIDARRVYYQARDKAGEKHIVVELDEQDAGPNGERLRWYQCTVKRRHMCSNGRTVRLRN
eukprot:scaffold2068_cov96-Cylindrotheca_fusiformis.AAC.20